LHAVESTAAISAVPQVDTNPTVVMMFFGRCLRLGEGKAMTNEILTITEVAKELRCSKAHVYNAINGKASGVSRLPAIHMGRRKLVRRYSLELRKSENERAILGESSEIAAVGA
jgi:hypothetical protein